MSDYTDADTAEQQARIHQLQNDAILKALDRLKRTQDIAYAPIALLATGLGAGAALVGAGAALVGAIVAFMRWMN